MLTIAVCFGFFSTEQSEPPLPRSALQKSCQGFECGWQKSNLGPSSCSKSAMLVSYLHGCLRTWRFFKMVFVACRSADLPNGCGRLKQLQTVRPAFWNQVWLGPSYKSSPKTSINPLKILKSSPWFIKRHVNKNDNYLKKTVSLKMFHAAVVAVSHHSGVRLFGLKPFRHPVGFPLLSQPIPVYFLHPAGFWGMSRFGYSQRRITPSRLKPLPLGNFGFMATLAHNKHSTSPWNIEKKSRLLQVGMFWIVLVCFGILMQVRFTKVTLKIYVFNAFASSRLRHRVFGRCQIWRPEDDQFEIAHVLSSSVGKPQMWTRDIWHFMESTTCFIIYIFTMQHHGKHFLKLFIYYNYALWFKTAHNVAKHLACEE